MPAAITDKFTSASSGSRAVPTTLSATKTQAATTISCAALTGWPTGTAVHFSIYTTTTTNGVTAKTPNSQTDWKGIVSGSTITNLTLRAGTDNGYGIGAIVEAAPTAAWADDMVTGMTAEHTQAGIHNAAAAASVAANLPSGSVAGSKLTATSVAKDRMDWSSFALNMKSASNTVQVNPINGEQDLASGASISFTVASACNAMVTVSLGVFSAGDYEYRPEIRLNGNIVATFSPSAASAGAGRAQGRTFTTVIPLASGVNLLSPGVFLGSGSGYQLIPGSIYIAALVLGNVTA